MPRFRKPIVSAGAYEIPIPGSDNSRTEVITQERLVHWADTGNSMVKEGHRIPGPWYHDPKALPVKMGSDGSLNSSSDNGGFWDRFWVENKDGKSTLWGEIDSPGREDDPNTPAGKIGTTVRETSIYVRPSFRDGSGKEWQDAMMHIGLVTHPIEKGQENFRPVSEGLALSMSQCRYSFSMSEHPAQPMAGISVNELLAKLREIAKVSLPGDTTDVNFLDRLNAALEQKRLSEEEESGTVRVPPKGAQEPPAPMITMSLTKQQIDAIVTAKTVNPATGQPFKPEELQMSQPSTKEELQDHPVVKKMVEFQTILMSQLNGQALTNRTERVKAILIKAPQLKPVIEAQVVPLLSSFKMSFSPDGSPTPHAVDTVLDALEAVATSAAPATAMSQPKPSDLATSWLNQAPSHMLPQNQGDIAAMLGLAMSQPPKGSQEVQPTDNGVVTEENAEDIAKQFLGQAGL
jgi:hypothetical protein